MNSLPAPPPESAGPSSPSGPGSLRRLTPWLAMLLVLISSVWLVARYGVNLPTGDEWDLARTLLTFSREGVDSATLFAFHNEHRIVVPRLYFHAAAAATGWNVTTIKLLNLLPVAATAWLLVHLALRQLRSATAVVTLAVISALLLGSWAQWQNFLWSFQFPWFFVPFLLVLSCWMLVQFPDRPLSRIGTLASLLASTACVANGLVTWIAILPLWFANSPDKKTRWVRLLLWSVGFAAACVVAMAGAPESQGNSVKSLLGHPFKFAYWFLFLLGQPLVGCLVKGAGAVSGPELPGVLAGVVVLLAVVLPVYHVTYPRTPLRPMASLGLVLIAFGLLSGLAISAGRFAGGQEAMSQSRYVTFTQYVILGAVIVMADIGNARAGRPALLTRLGLVSAGLLLLVPYVTLRPWLQDLRLAHLRLKGVLALSGYAPLHAELQRLAHNSEVSDFLRRLDALEVSDLLPPRIPVAAVPVAAIARRTLPGNVDGQRSENEGRIYEGWVVDERSNPVPVVVAAQLVDRDYFRIVGVSSDARIQRPDVALALKAEGAASSGWRVTVPRSAGDNVFLLAFDPERNRFHRFP